MQIVAGDARTSLARESPQHFDVLVVDALSGDAIPIYLLTTEALAIYRRHLAPKGILAFHISNRHVDLAPAIALLAASAGIQALRVSIRQPDAYTSHPGCSQQPTLISLLSRNYPRVHLPEPELA